MANTLDPMDLKQIITLHLDEVSNRKIADTLGISRNTVNTYMRLFKGSDYTFKELLSLDNSGLETLFPSHTTIDNTRYDALMLYFEGMNKARNHPGFTFLYHYGEYSQRVKQPYGYTQFMEHYRRKYAHHNCKCGHQSPLLAAYLQAQETPLSPVAPQWNHKPELPDNP